LLDAGYLPDVASGSYRQTVDDDMFAFDWYLVGDYNVEIKSVLTQVKDAYGINLSTPVELVSKLDNFTIKVTSNCSK